MDSSPLSSVPSTPTDSSAPLPVPTTLETHIRGPRFLRSASRTSRSPRPSSMVCSQTSSRTPQSEVVEPLQAERSAGGSSAVATQELPSRNDRSIGATDFESSNPRSLLERLDMPPVQSSRKRRRAYSIHDEVPTVQEASGQLSTSESSADIPSFEFSEPPSKKRRITLTKKASKRRKVRDIGAGNAEAGPSTVMSSRAPDASSDLDVEVIRLPGESTADEGIVLKIETRSPSVAQPAPPISSEPLSEYSCPICFSPPTNATLTQCGHICCGECLFTAVRSSLQRAATSGPPREPVVARCPVCRAILNGWDGRGGGVIGLRPRTVISL